MKHYFAIGAVLGFIVGCVSGPFVAWFIMEWLVQRLPILAGSGLTFVWLWGMNVLLATPAFAVAAMLLLRFEIAIESERPRRESR